MHLRLLGKAMARFAVLLLRGGVLVSLAGGCTGYRGTARGRVGYVGRDPIGAYSGVVAPVSCQAFLERAGGSGGSASDWVPRADFVRCGNCASLSLDPPEHALPATVARVVLFTDDAAKRFELDRSRCDLFDVREWFGDDHTLHAVVRLDCRPHPDEHVWGTLETNRCYVVR